MEYIILYNLQTNLIHARRVADEQQEIINELTKERDALQKDFQWLLSVCENIDTCDLSPETAAKLRLMLVKYVG